MPRAWNDSARSDTSRTDTSRSRTHTPGAGPGDGVRIGDIVLRNRVVTSSSLLGYGVANSPLVPYGMSPVSLFVPLSAFGAVTTRTLTVEPREGHFTTQDRWPLRELPGLLRRYDTVLQRTDAGFVNAFGWCNVGIDAYLRDYYPRTRDQWTIISLGGFSAAEFVTLIDRVNAAVPAGDIAAVELNVSCHNVNFDFSTILQDVLDEAVPRSNHPVLLKLSPDYDYLRNAAQAARAHSDTPHVWLTMSRTRLGRAEIEVADNGPGVPEGLRQDIFLPFFTTRADGTGVGLSLARQVVLAHRGAISVGDREGGGALFRIVI